MNTPVADLYPPFAGFFVAKQIVFWALLIASIAAGPTSAPDEKIWDLGFAKGTATEVGVKLNSEAVRLAHRRQQMLNQIAEEKAVNDRLRKARLDTVHSTDAYKTKAADLARIERELDASRKAHSGESITLSSELNHDKADMSLMEFTAINSDDALNRSTKIIDGYADDLRKTDPALKAANDWRDQIVGGVVGSLQLKWPLRAGEIGLLSNIESVEITPRGTTFHSRAIEWLDQISEKEKISTYHVIEHPFLGVISDGQPDAITAVRVERVSDDDGLVVHLRVLPDDEISLLMRALHSNGDLEKH